MRTVIVLLCLVDYISAYRAYDLIQETHLTEETLQRLQEKMAKLNELQIQLLPKKNGRGPGKRPSPEDENPQSINITQEIAAKPDQLPYLFEGDIVLTDDQMDEILRNAEDQLWASITKRKKRSMTSNLALRWSFPVPYFIDLNTGVSEAAVLAGINRWQQDTCVTFTRLNSLPSSTSALHFILGNGCYSYIGKMGPQMNTVSIGYGCTSLGTVTHEIGHALGFYHEQSRFDRDNYVSIQTQNIQQTYWSQFSKQSKSSMIDYGVGYDLGSVMHYDQYAFTSNGGQTILTSDPNYQMTIGQRLAPSFADVKRINLAYCNTSCSVALDCRNGGYTDPKNCQQCRCPDGFGGVICDRAANANAACGVGDLTATDQLQTIQASGAIKCPYVITAPAGKKIFFTLGNFAFTNFIPCSVDYLEIKYGTEFVSAGARFCRNFPTNSLSETNQLIVIYKGSANTGFSLNYRYDPPTPLPTTTTTTTTTTVPPTTESTTTTTITTPTTTTTTTAPMSSTLLPTISTPSPITTQPSETSTRRATWKTRATRPPITTTTQKPITTTATPKPAVWTFFPKSSTPPSPPSNSRSCSAWTACTAQCGGCGTTSRRCQNGIETKNCNVQPCPNGFCCLPYFYVKQGLCVKPYSDEDLIASFSHSTDEDAEIIESSGQQP